MTESLDPAGRNVMHDEPIPTDRSAGGDPAQPAGFGDGARPGAAAVVVICALLVGAGALAVSSVLESGGLRLLIAVVLVVGGWLVSRSAAGLDRPVILALGTPVLRGIGTSFVVLGGYLGGLASLTMSVPDSGGAGPSAVEVVLLAYGIPALALLAVATSGMRAWTAGAGAVLPMVAVLLMTTAGAPTAAVSITMLVVAVVLAVFVVRSPASSGWGGFAAAAAAMAASYAFGAGTSPFGSLGLTQFGGTVKDGIPAGTLPGPALTAVLAGALLVAAVLVATAVVRRDFAGGVLAGSLFAAPPVLLAGWLPPDMRWPTEVLAAVVGVPALVAVVAASAIRFRAVRRVLAGARHAGATSAAACATVVAVAAMAFAAAAMPVLGWPPLVQGIAALLIIAVTAALAYWLPGTPGPAPDAGAPEAGSPPGAGATSATGVPRGRPAGVPGAVAAVVALLGIRLASPWENLVASIPVDSVPVQWLIIGVLDLAGVAVLAWFLVRRHRRLAVYAAATYAFAGGLASLIVGLLFNSDYLNSAPLPFNGELAPVAVIGVPLLLLGVVAVVALFRGRTAVAQTVGAVVLAAGGFVPLKILVGEFTRGTDTTGVPPGLVARLSLAPLTPTDSRPQASYLLREVTGPALVGVLLLVLLALVLAASLAWRPSAPLAGAVALVLLAAVQSGLLTALSAGSADDARLLGDLAGVAAVVAVVVAASAARRE